MAILQKSKRLKKELGLLDVYALATGTTLSAGFFLLPGLAATYAGPAVPLAYVIAAIPLIPAMFCVVELATAMPRAGGTYYFLDRSMGPIVGTIGGLGTWLVLSLKTAFALIGMGAYIRLFAPGLPILPVAVAFALLFGIVNLFGAKSAGWFQLVLVSGLLFILVWFMSGIFHIVPQHFEGFFDEGVDSIFAAAGLVYVSYIGVTKVASVSEEIRNPERNLPLGIFLGLGTAIIIYVIGTAVMVGVVPMSELQGNLTPVATAANKFAGKVGQVLMVTAALLAFSSVANAGILGASRYPLAMGRDHLLPPCFRKFNKRGVPVNGVLATVGLVLFFLAVFDPIKIAKLASAFQLILFALICLAVIVMRESRIASYDPGYRSPLYPWMQIVGIIAPMMLIPQMGWLPLLFSLGLLVAGTGWYFHYAHQKVSRVGAIYHIFERLGRRRFEGLDAELRGILKEKGLRENDPFDEIVARAQFIDVAAGTQFEDAAQMAAKLLSERINGDPAHIGEGFMRGTRVGATPVSRGAALPHLRLPGLLSSELVLVRVHSGMQIVIMDEFGEEMSQDQPVHALFFLLSSEENPGQHLRILAQIAGRIDDQDFMRQWLASDSEQDIKEVLLRDERYLSIHLDGAGPSETLIGKKMTDLRFPEGCLVATIRRGTSSIVPRGTTRLQADDRLTIIGDPEGIGQLRAEFD